MATACHRPATASYHCTEVLLEHNKDSACLLLRQAVAVTPDSEQQLILCRQQTDSSFPGTARLQ